jgi:hypothetical protein
LIEATRPILTKHGIAITQWPSMVERGTDGYLPALVTVLTCSGSDDRMDFTCPLYLNDKNMQGLGAAVTYARRYAWAAALGIASEEDTDAVTLPADDVPFGEYQ